MLTSKYLMWWKSAMQELTVVLLLLAAAESSLAGIDCLSAHHDEGYSGALIVPFGRLLLNEA